MRRRWAADSSSGGTWALCRFAKLPLTDSQDILWSGDPRKGVFGRATAEQRIARQIGPLTMSGEDFLLHGITENGDGVLGAFVGGLHEHGHVFAQRLLA